jgi:preprotein translocase subunit SecE
VITESVVVVVFVIFFTCLIVGLDHVFAALFNAVLFGK